VFGVRVHPVSLAGQGDRVISPAGAAVPVVVVTAREDLEIARQTERAANDLREGVSPAAR
jgi:hypothetical protein